MIVGKYLVVGKKPVGQEGSIGEKLQLGIEPRYYTVEMIISDKMKDYYEEHGVNILLNSTSTPNIYHAGSKEKRAPNIIEDKKYQELLRMLIRKQVSLETVATNKKWFRSENYLYTVTKLMI